jgi:hypothetical protein
MDYKFIIQAFDTKVEGDEMVLEDSWVIHSFQPCGSIESENGRIMPLFAFLMQRDPQVTAAKTERKPIGLGRQSS